MALLRPFRIGPQGYLGKGKCDGPARWARPRIQRRSNPRRRLEYQAILWPWRIASQPHACTYIHLNPARAKLIRIGEQKLWEYPWSSYPDYVCREAPEWLETGRVPGSLGLRPQDR